MPRADVTVVGAGLAGLACARALAAAKVPVRVLEASDGVGGRARTDFVNGFLLDRGFQTVFTAYPELKRALDVTALKLHAFEPSVRVFRQGRLHTFADPLRQPAIAFASLLNPVGTVRDKLRLLKLRSAANAGSLSDLLSRPQETTLERLKRLGFSPLMREAYFQPLLGGMFFDRELTTSSRLLELTIRMVSEGQMALPEGGMGTLADQLAAQLPAGTLQLGTPVQRVGPKMVELPSGEKIESGSVVVATDGVVAAKLVPSFAAPQSCAGTTLYFAAPAPPVKGAHLILNGDGKGVVNSAAVISEISPSYAPSGQALVAATVLGLEPYEGGLLGPVRAHLSHWFGDEVVSSWEHLRTYAIAHALPAQPPSKFEPAQRPVTTHGGVFVCGDHRDNGTLDGALVSGRRCAEAVMAAQRNASR